MIAVLGGLPTWSATYPHPHRRRPQPGAEAGQHMGDPRISPMHRRRSTAAAGEGATLAELARSYGVGKSTIFSTIRPAITADARG